MEYNKSTIKRHKKEAALPKMEDSAACYV